MSMSARIVETLQSTFSKFLLLWTTKIPIYQFEAELNSVEETVCNYAELDLPEKRSNIEMSLNSGSIIDDENIP